MTSMKSMPVTEPPVCWMVCPELLFIVCKYRPARFSRVLRSLLSSATARPSGLARGVVGDLLALPPGMTKLRPSSAELLSTYLMSGESHWHWTLVLLAMASKLLDHGSLHSCWPWCAVVLPDRSHCRHVVISVQMNQDLSNCFLKISWVILNFLIDIVFFLNSDGSHIKPVSSRQSPWGFS